MVARIGRSLFSTPTGVVAAFLLSITPWHIRQSAIFKPDILLVLIELVAFEWALQAVTPAGFLRAGVGVGLALSSKFTGGVIGIPLAVGSFLVAARWRQKLGLLVAATAAALLTFLLLNPYLVIAPELYGRDFGRTLRNYAWKAAVGDATRMDIVGHAATVLASASFHGVLVGIAALVGLLWVAARMAQAPLPRRRMLLMFLSYPVAYVGLYALVTQNPSPHNWLPLAPFTSLAAAEAVGCAGHRVGARFAQRRSRRLLRGVALLLAIPFLGSATLYVYREAVPSTWELAVRFLKPYLAEQGARRIIVQEGVDSPRLGGGFGRRERPVLVSSAILQGHSPTTWEGVDAVVHRSGSTPRLSSEPLAKARPSQTHLLEPAVFRAHGPRLRIVLNTWRWVGSSSLPATAGNVYRVPEVATGRFLSFEVFVPKGATVAQSLEVVSESQTLPLLYGGWRGPHLRFVTPRAHWAAPLVEVSGASEVARVRAHLWTAGSESGQR
jgi:4-amino-4-deoxy-L-arabinose transferase-like glycosyltransferase